MTMKITGYSGIYRDIPGYSGISWDGRDNDNIPHGRDAVGSSPGGVRRRQPRLPSPSQPPSWRHEIPRDPIILPSHPAISRYIPVYPGISHYISLFFRPIPSPPGVRRRWASRAKLNRRGVFRRAGPHHLRATEVAAPDDPIFQGTPSSYADFMKGAPTLLSTTRLAGPGTPAVLLGWKELVELDEIARIIQACSRSTFTALAHAS